MPTTKQTIAIIGSSSMIGRSIAKAICKDNYRLLLFDENTNEAEALSGVIFSSVHGADVEVLSCIHDACWEADVILILKNDNDYKDLSEKIEDVSTQKIIVILLMDEHDYELELAESFFPNSKLVGLYPSKSISKNIHFITRHSKALETVRSMVFAAGFQPVLKELMRH